MKKKKELKPEIYSKELDSFIKNIQIEDADVYNRLDNLYGAGQISEDVYYIFDEDLQKKLAEKVVESVKNSLDAEDALQEEMDMFPKWYDEEDLKKFDYRDALYNCDKIYLKAISECIDVPLDDLSEYEMDFDSFALITAKRQDMDEMKKIEALAFKQWNSSGNSISYICFDLGKDTENDVVIVNPWMDPTGCFPVDPVEEYGEEAFNKFCNEMKAKMNFLVVVENAKTAALRNNYDQFIIESEKGGYSFTRAGGEKSTTPILGNEKIIGKVSVKHQDGILIADYKEIRGIAKKPTIKFRNVLEERTLDHATFVEFVWEEAEKNFNENSKGVWCNLTKEEQIALYCKQFEHQLNDGGWELIHK